MKRYLSLLAVVMMSCYMNSPVHETTTLSLFIDTTDTLENVPSLAEIKSLLDFENNKWNGADVSVQILSNIDYNSVSTCSLVKREQLLSNPDERAREISSFITSLDKIIKEGTSSQVGYTTSSIYEPIARELNRLAISSASRKILCSYSDLCENTNHFSIYNLSSKALLKTDDSVAREMFKSVVPLRSLQGITIYLMYKPKNPIDNENFKLMSILFASLFKEAGATVIIGANIQS